MKSALTRENVRKIIKLRETGVSWNDITARTGFAESTWKAAADRFGMELPYRMRRPSHAPGGAQAKLNSKPGAKAKRKKR
jgi:hypothetical protein